MDWWRVRLIVVRERDHLNPTSPSEETPKTSPSPTNADAVISTVSLSPVFNGRDVPFSIECFRPRLSQLVHGSNPTL